MYSPQAELHNRLFGWWFINFIIKLKRRKKVMSETKEFKNGNGERPENENQETTEQEEEM